MIVVYLMPCANMRDTAALVSGFSAADVHACSLKHWDGVPIRSVGNSTVTGVYANGNASVAEIYRMAGIPVVDAPPVLASAESVAIYCPGPSLLPLPEVVADATIAVNRAIEAVPADYWMCLDPGGFAMFRTTGPRICCVSRERVVGMNVFPVDRNEMPCKAGRFSTTAAVHFALHHLHAKRVTIYGADMSGAKDFTGASAGGRSADRWRLERECLQDLIAYAATCGNAVAIHRRK